MKEGKGLGRAAGVLVAAMLVAAAATFLALREAPPAETKKIRIASTKTPAATLLIVADERGFLRNAGLDVDITWLATGRLTTEAMEAETHDVAGAAEFILATKAFSNSGLRTFASIAELEDHRVVARRDRGIARPVDLKGKRIGVTLGTSGEFFFGRFLALNGIAGEDVTLVNMAPPEMAGAITEGRIDAAITWPPAIVEVQERLGERAISFDSQGGQKYFFLLISSRTWLDAHPAEAERLLAALIHAEEWAAANPDEARKMVARRTGTAEERLAGFWRSAHLTVGLPQALLVAVDAEARWAARRGVVDKGSEMPDFAAHVTDAPLRRVKPAAVGIFN